MNVLIIVLCSLDNTNSPQYIDDSMPYGSTVDYKVSATDENSNESEFTY